MAGQWPRELARMPRSEDGYVPKWLNGYMEDGTQTCQEHLADQHGVEAIPASMSECYQLHDRLHDAAGSNSHDELAELMRLLDAVFSD